MCGRTHAARSGRNAAEIPGADTGCTGEEREAQFDLIAVEVMPGGETEVRLIPQAMEYNW